MSPESKRRKRKPTGRGAGAPPGPDQIVARTVQVAARELERVPDALQAELYVSEMLGAWWGLFIVDDDPEVVFGEAVVAYAGSRKRTGALALLRCIAVLGTERQRAQAAAAADALAARGVAEPAWVEDLGAERVTMTWAYGDVYGDQTTVLLGVDRAGVEHGVAVLVDHTLGGIAKDAFVTADPVETLDDLRELADGAGVWLRELSHEEAGGMLAPALAATDAAVEPPVNEDFPPFRALANARARLVPAPPPQPAPTVDAEQRHRIVEEFLASDAGRDLPAGARACIELIVDFGADVDRGQPLRVSPAKTERFLFGWLPEQPDPGDAVLAALNETLPAWADWAGARVGLPAEALAELREIIDEMTTAFDEDDGIAPGGAPADVYIAGVDLDGLDAYGLRDLIERRFFAMPFGTAKIGDEYFAHLDPSDPDDRAVLIRGEHPEYHDAPADPDPDVVGGVNPRLHVAVHEIVANQLWDDDPPEAWQAAQRLLESGMDRHDALHAIGEVLVTHLHGVLTGRGPTNVAAYVTALKELG
ncbi:DUF1841 family protein [Pseudonocardia nigra]|uniref:DUF1841 family protein n=1 Tax=Pseudonocardia nigra TaxID=1921578 RepID=UPI001C5F20A2|nr:DUF1841 family protein [Pseudonocardia nigra]